MAITLELKPEIEAQLVRRALQCGVPVSEYVEKLIADVEAAREHGNIEAYLDRVRKVLRKFDELPRLGSSQSADQIIGYDQWGLPLP
jgi:hypothetical protein